MASSNPHGHSDHEWAEDLMEMGFCGEQIDYLLEANRLVSTCQVGSLEELQERIGYGVVDEAVLRDTFFDR